MEKKQLIKALKHLTKAKNIIEETYTNDPDKNFLKIRTDLIRVQLFLDSLIWKPEENEQETSGLHNN